MEKATGRMRIENHRERGILERKYSGKQDYNWKTHIMRFGPKEETIRETTFKDLSEEGIQKN